MAQYDRVYKIMIGVQGDKDGVLIEGKPFGNGLNISFSIGKDLSQQTNKATITIYNLSEATAKKVERDDAIIELLVGYSEDNGLKRIFLGYITQVKTSWKSGERQTEISASDGQIAIRDCVVALSYYSSVSRKKVIDDIAKKMGMNVFYAKDCVFTSFAKGFSFVGAGKKCLDKACAGSDLEWSIQNNILQVLKKGGDKKLQAIKLTPETGLIGSVEYVTKASFLVKKENEGDQTGKPIYSRKNRKQGHKLTCLLQPTIAPGDIIYIKARGVEGVFMCAKLTHNGEYQGQNWYTEMTVYALDDEEEKKKKDAEKAKKQEEAKKKEESKKDDKKDDKKDEQGDKKDDKQEGAK